jgi:DNA primase small subunit
MAKTIPLDAPALAWARAEFARYYRTAVIAPPDRLARREFAAFPFAEATVMRRHATLPTPAELAVYLREVVPRHVYYSSAYYRLPAEPTMAAKGWLGADLIFDLDSDHLRGASELDYAGQLELVKSRLLDLVDDFLVRDFGVDSATTSFVFSGGRGYHVHVRDEKFLSLTSPERREIVDYVLGIGVSPRATVERRAEDVSAGRTVGPADDGEVRRPRGGPAHTVQLAAPEAPGWRGRTTRAVFKALDEWETRGWKTAAREMTEAGIAPERARRWAKHLVEGGWAERIRSTRTLDVFGKESPDDFLEHVIHRVAVNVQAETDAPVTTDIHRLIRLPGSLHGGTGLRVVPLSRDEVDRFDPFHDAVIDGRGEERSTGVTFLQEVRYPFPDGGLHGVAGATGELPTAQALFLVLRGEASLRPSPGG